MSDNLIEVKITLSDPQEKDEKLQEMIEILRLELQDTKMVQTADLMVIDDAPPGAKSIGGFILGELKAFVDLKKLKSLVEALGNRCFGQTIKIEAKGNGRELKVQISRPEDLAKIMPDIDKFIKG